MMNASIENHGRQLDFSCEADRVVFVREDAGSASNTEASILLYHSYITSSTGNTEVN